jgi:ribonuclease G
MNRASAFLRDVFNSSFDKIIVDDAELAAEFREYLEEIAPEKVKIVKHFTGKTPIFQYFGIDRQLKSAFGRSVSMSKGAYLIIEHTEAMHVIDVNSGNRSNQGQNQEQNALAVNLVAAEEVARQLRLRDMGGIIVIDFIDMHNAENRKILFEKLREEMKLDRAKHKILPPSKFGLVEITRQRTRPEMNIPTREENPDQLIEAPILLIDQMEQEFEAIAKSVETKEVQLHVHPFIGAYLTKGWLNSIAKKWKKMYKQKLRIVSRDAFKMLEYKFLDANNSPIKRKKS